jgi:hypothetical protein
MPSIRYKGPHSAVDVPSLDNAVVNRGESTEVTAEQAAAFIDQADWELVAPAPAPKPNKDGSN